MKSDDDYLLKLGLSSLLVPICGVRRERCLESPRTASELGFSSQNVK